MICFLVQVLEHFHLVYPENIIPIYDMYGISNVNGLRAEKFNYMADVFWPYIYGQFGFWVSNIYCNSFQIFKRQMVRLRITIR